jgi:hypothetical protein
MSDLPPPVRELIEVVLDRTERGKLQWRSSGTGLVLPREKGSLEIRARDDDGQHPFDFSVRDPDGSIVDTYASTETNAYGDEEGTAYYQLFERLFRAASRSSQGSVKVVNDLLSDLRGDDDIPF